jgi:hypothetical protein
MKATHSSAAAPTWTSPRPTRADPSWQKYRPAAISSGRFTAGAIRETSSPTSWSTTAGRLDEVDAEGSLVDTDALLAKYSPSGELVWEQALGGAEQSTGLGLANDHMGHVILCGWDYDPAVPQDETAARGFLIRFD